MAELPQTQLDLYWNVFRNIAAEIKTPTDGYDFNRETLTYFQADPRYLTYLDQYLATQTSISDEDKTRIRGEAETAHRTANATLDSPGYAFSTTMYGMSQDLYHAVENNMPEIIGTLANRPAETRPEVALVAEPIVPADMPYVEPVYTGVGTPEDPTFLGTIYVTADPPYEVQSGDNLWKIAREQLGLTDNAEIARAVEHIAQLNGMTDGNSANRLNVGDSIILPTAEELAGPRAEPLDWAALDRDVSTGMVAAATPRREDPIRFETAATGTEHRYTIGEGGTLSRSIFAAARDQGITLDRAQLAGIITRVAEANDIDNPNVVQANQTLSITRAMLAPAGMG